MPDNSVNDSNVLEYLKSLREKGYDKDFILEGNKLKCKETGNSYSQRELLVDEFRRFEGMSNPSDMSVVFAVSCPDGNKGTVMCSYGPYADATLDEFMQDVKIREE